MKPSSLSSTTRHPGGQLSLFGGQAVCAKATLLCVQHGFCLSPGLCWENDGILGVAPRAGDEGTGYSALPSQDQRKVLGHPIWKTEDLEPH